jgi:hypothetical protein
MTLQAEVALSRHARRRGAQSNLSDRDLDLVRRYGVLEHRTGVRFYAMVRPVVNADTKSSLGCENRPLL